MHIDLTTFNRSTNFYPKLNLMAAITHEDAESGALGSVAHFQLQGGQASADVLAQMLGPGAIATRGSSLAMSSGKEVLILDGAQIRTIKDPWLSDIRALDFSADGRLLVTASGFDAILEYDLATLERTFEWFAWEHGFHSGTDPNSGDSIRLSRVPLPEHTGAVHLIDDPENQELSPAMRAARINGAVYDSNAPDHLLAALSNQGAIYRINRQTGGAEVVLDGLQNPTGSRGYLHGSILATSSAGGEIIIAAGPRQYRIDFRNLPGGSAQSSECLQNTIAVDNLLITIDAKRSAIAVIDWQNQQYDFVSYDGSWNIQDIIALGPEVNTAQIRQLNQRNVHE